MSSSPLVLIDRLGRVGILTLNRPEKLNALNSQLVRELDEAIRALDTDEEIGAIVVTGAGDRAFSAGGDLAEQVTQHNLNPSGPSRRPPWFTVAGCRKPTLAAIRGYCFGGGAALALSFDIRIASECAKFKFQGASYGRAVGGALLPRVVGEARAKELLFTGDEVDAQLALRYGLVNHVVAPAELMNVTLAMASRIAGQSAHALQALKETVEMALPIERAAGHEQDMNRQLRSLGDSQRRLEEAAARVLGRSSDDA